MEESKEPIKFDMTVFVNVIEKLKVQEKYEELDLSAKIQFKANVQLETAYILTQAIEEIFKDVPAYEPNSLGQLAIDMTKTIFPETEDLMKFIWIPWLLSPKTVERFDTRLSDEQYKQIREFADSILKSDNPISEENKEHFERIVKGLMPENVLSPGHSRWEIRDCLTNEVKNRAAVETFKTELTQHKI